MLEILFWLAAVLIVFHYLGYPLLIALLARLWPRPHQSDESLRPTVSLIIAAYNEERVIEAKIRNSLALDYPAERLQIIVVSDGSSDATPEIVRRYADRGVIGLHLPERRGKTAALNRAVAHSRADIIVFSDANNDFSADAIRALVRHFADATVGGVSGLKQIKAATDRASTEGDGLYWRYESKIKQAESRFGSITGGDGEIFAIRRTLYRTIDERVINDDAAITFEIVKRGYRVLYDTQARSYEYASIKIRDDFYVKVRMVAGGFQTVAHEWRRLLLPRSAFDACFLAHKLLRWIIPELLLIVFIGAIALSGQAFYLALAVLQIAFYGLALYGWRRGGQVASVIYIPFYFAAMNLAAFYGLVRFISKRQGVAWRKAAR